MSQVKMVEVSLEMFEGLVARVAALEEKLSKPKADSVEMTDEHAVRILSGDLADKKHKEAAEMLGLTYGQVYSARLGYTFKHIAKKLKDEGVKNQWVK